MPWRFYVKNIQKKKAIKIVKLYAFTLSFLISLNSHAEEIRSPFIKPTNPMQSLMIENTNLSAKKYFDALMSNSIEDRRYSEMYLLGVLDSTEGVVWCDYGEFKTITIDEILFVEFKKLSDNFLKERASNVIKDILGKKFPCRGQK